MGTCALCKKDDGGDIDHHLSVFHPDLRPDNHGKGNFRAGLIPLGTFIVLLSGLSTIPGKSDLWGAGALAFALGLVAGVLSLLLRKTATGNGILVAIAIGIISLSTTCGVNIGNGNFELEWEDGCEGCFINP